MQSANRTLRELDSLQLKDTITAIDCSQEFVAAGCLDDTVNMWRRDKQSNSISFKDPFWEHTGDSMGIVDISFNGKGNILAASCMDSTIHLYDTGTKTITEVECDVMENWKCDCVDNMIMTGGDTGKVNLINITTKDREKKLTLGDIFVTALGKSRNLQWIAAGNNNGQVIIASNTGKDRSVLLKNHHKIVRDICFIEEDTKLLSGADDSAIKMVDIASQKVIHAFEGHKLGVTAVTPHQDDCKIFFSTSFDKSIKIWDPRTKTCVGTQMTSSPLWDCRSLGKNLVAGGDTGVLFILAFE